MRIGWRLLWVSLLAVPMILGLAATRVAVAGPVAASLSYEQNEDRTAFIALVRKARQGDAQAQWQVGATYARLDDPARALPMLRSAAQAGHPQAATLLGWFYENGRGTAKNMDEARRWYRAGIDRDQADAMAALGRLLLKEPGAESRQAAQQLLQRAADRNDPDGQYYLGWMLVQGTESARGDAEAYAWFRKAAAQGHVGAQLAVATHLLTGRGVAKGRKAAGEWLLRAARKQDPVAHYLLGRLNDGDRAVDLERARNSFRIAAAAGHREAQFALASLLAKSREAADRKEAAEWFGKAQEAGHKAAANRLGELYRDGVGALQQHDKARVIFQRAAEQGDADAMYNLAAMQHDGLGGLRDTDLALKWYTRAADAGHERAFEVVERLLNSSVKTSALGLKGFWQ
jgi:TPR repeat protein